MADAMPTAHKIAHTHEAPDTVTLTYEDRFLRRKVLAMDSGEQFLVDLGQTTSLGDGDAFELEDGRLVAVKTAPETLLQVTGPDLVRLAWHIGNRHTPCQIEEYRLLIARDHVLEAMLAKLDADMKIVHEPFTPEGGAYGHGRTFGHDHGHGHSHDQGHSHAHPHSHDH